MRRSVYGIAALLAAMAHQVQAQTAKSPRAEVQAFVQSYAEAANRGDAAAYASMYKESPDLVMIEDGQVKRGWAAVRDEANQALGAEGSYRISVGVIDVLPLGSVRALASFPFVLTLQTANGPQQMQGASTLVLEKAGGKWLIVHDHTSYQRPNPNQAE
jgi:uncharacterized protein (TIGR02246 family)